MSIIVMVTHFYICGTFCFKKAQTTWLPSVCKIERSSCSFIMYSSHSDLHAFHNMIGYHLVNIPNANGRLDKFFLTRPSKQMFCDLRQSFLVFFFFPSPPPPSNSEKRIEWETRKALTQTHYTFTLAFLTYNILFSFLLIFCIFPVKRCFPTNTNLGR